MRDDVHGDLRGEYLRLGLFPLRQCQHLRLQLHKARLPRAGHRLISARHHGLYGAELCDAAHGHKRDDGGTVGVCDDALIFKGVLPVYLRHDQRHLRIHPEGGAVVYVHRAAFHYRGGEAFGHRVFHRAQHKVHPREAVLARLFYFYVLPLEGHRAASALRACQRQKLLHRDVVLLQHLQHFLPDCARCPEYRHIVFFHFQCSFHFSACKAVIQDAYRLFKIAVLHAHYYTQLIRPLCDGADVYPLVAQRLEYLARHARPERHLAPDRRHE